MDHAVLQTTDKNVSLDNWESGRVISNVDQQKEND